MGITYNNVDGPPRVVAQRGKVIWRFRDNHNKVGERRPGFYTADSLLWGWFPHVGRTESSARKYIRLWLSTCRNVRRRKTFSPSLVAPAVK